MRPLKQLALVTSVLAFSTGVAFAASDAKLDAKVASALKQCQQVSKSCASNTASAVGVLVFPNVVSADLLIGGAGGKGALIENGKITGYYNIGAASAGLQAGISSSSQIYAFKSSQALAKLKDGSEWKSGASADVTLVEADANASAATGDVLAYVFDSKGLHAGVSLDVFNIWKSDEKRPAA